MDVISIGDNVVDCYLDQGKYYPGGNAVNFAVGCKRYGATHSSYIGVFATDDKADHIKFALDKEGIDFNYSRTVVGISGQPQVNIDESGDRIFVGSRKDTVQHKVRLRLTEEDYKYIENYNLCHTSCFSWLEDELPLLSKSINISFDFSDNINKEYFEKVCPYIKYAFISGSNLSEKQLRDLICFLSQFNIEIIGITRGNKPAIFIKDQQKYTQEVKEIEVKDTMGAGDSFISAFLVDYIKHMDITRALSFAAEYASETCKISGGFGYPKSY